MEEVDNGLQRALSLAEELKLSQDPTWHSLLHYQNGRCHIDDRKFLLGGEDCSLDKELQATLRSFYIRTQATESHSICRFPARYFFIQHRLLSKNFNLPKKNCREVDIFLAKAPAEEISLVYASENVTHPASMMGHVFIKLSGSNYKNIPVNHAVSYFTRIETFNLPLLLAESFFLGMPSFFSLMPYSEQIKMYIENEERNIWEYSLLLSPEQRRLIQFHIWELKEVQSKYLFTGYNCATVIYFILSLADSSFLEVSRLWVSPIDVVKQASKSALIGKTIITPSLQWKIRMLASHLDSPSRDKVYRSIQTGDLLQYSESNNSDSSYIEWELGKTFAVDLYNRGEISEQTYENMENGFAAYDSVFIDKALDLSAYKNPLLRPDDSQFALGYLFQRNNSYIKFDFLPASHTLTDDNRQTFSESALELGSLTLLIDTEDGAISLEKFNLYAAKSLVPWDRFVGGLSTDVRVSYDRHYQKSLESHKVGAVSGGMGISSLVQDDALFYILGNVGFAGNDEGVYGYTYPEIGIVINQAFNTKGIVSYKLLCGQGKNSDCYQRTDFNQSVFANRDVTFVFGYSQIWSSEGSDQLLELSLRRYF